MLKGFYLEGIKKQLPKIVQSQNSEGSFYIPYQKNVPIPNARWQEAVLTLAWAQKNLDLDFSKNIEKGILYWCSIQNEDGSFPEFSHTSFASTAFSSFAIAKALELIGEELGSKCFESALNSLEKTKNFLARHDNISRTNQEAAALLALKTMQQFIDVEPNILEDKLGIIVKNKTPSGFFREDDGVDVGYSSLTCELLGLYGRLDFCKDFIESLKYLLFPDGTLSCNFSRTGGWLILDFLEQLSSTTLIARKIADLHISAHKNGLCDATHLPSLRHVMTDTYRLCFAYDICNEIEGDVKLPFEDLNWDKKFPEGILVVRRPYYMCVYYLTNKLTQSIWFRNGIITNLSASQFGNTISTNKFTYTFENVLKFNYQFNHEKLWIRAKCNWKIPDAREPFIKAATHKAPLGIKTILKSLLNKFSRGTEIEKTYIFEGDKILVEVKVDKGMEQVPVLGNIQLSDNAFEKKKEKILIESIFHNREDFFVYQKKVSDRLSYVLKG